MKASIFHNNEYTNIVMSEPNIIPEECRENLKHIHTLQYLSTRKNNKITNTTSHNIYSSEQTLPCYMHTKLAQLRASKLPLLQSCPHTVNPKTYMPQWPLCLSNTQESNHFFNCTQVPTQHITISL